MKKLFMFLTAACILLALTANKAFAYKFSAVNNNGDTIYYNTTSDSTVKVTYDAIVYSGDIVIPDIVNNNDIIYTVTAIGDAAFYHCSGLTSVTIPNTVTTIGGAAFFWCSSLTSVTVPNSVIDIGPSAFYNCYNLTSVTIGNSVDTIKNFAFSSCVALTEIYVKAVKPPEIDEDTFEDVPKSIPVYVCGSVEDYRKAAYWSEFTNIIQDNDCNTDIEKLFPNNEITLYPNPATTDHITVILPENVAQAVFTVYDMQGKMLIRQQIGNQETVSVSNLAAGIYIYNVRTEKKSYQGKIIRK